MKADTAFYQDWIENNYKKNIAAQLIIPQISLVATSVISMASTNPMSVEAQEAVELLSKLPEVSVSDVIIRERKVYRDAIAEGKGVLE